METENTKMNEIRENGSAMRNFAEEFFKFGFEFTGKNGDLKLSPEELVTLYAIFKKNMRTERMNARAESGNWPAKQRYKDESATYKQKNMINFLIKKGKIKPDGSFDVEKLTSKEASQIISSALAK